MTPDIAARTGVEEEVLAAATSLVEAFGSGAVDTYFACFAPDATFIFHNHETRLTSTEAYRSLWDSWVEDTGFQILGCVSSDQDVRVLGDTALFTHAVETRARTKAGTFTNRERETILFVMRDRKWIAAHEHLSLQTG
ncbi:nuclear transport factor 2 family protein [Mesorhizobium sp. A623]